MKPVHELAQVIRLYKHSFIQKHHPLTQHLSVLNDIARCRTAAMGGHVDACNDCGHLRISYNSCRNRHCPKCQNTSRQRWIAAQQSNLIDAAYFHVVFTLPAELNCWCMHHPKEVYNLLFQCSKDTIVCFAKDDNHLGAIPGMTSVLHTWGQNLALHPHIHMIVPGGGIDDTGEWKPAKNNGKFLFPVKAMSIVFKHKFMEGFLLFLQEHNLCMDQQIRKTLYDKAWVVYAKQPFAGPAQVIEYLGRYSHKVAISNHRIKNIDNQKVTFTYKDYADKNLTKEMTLTAEEFLRRFCTHILPKGFRKIRHYGFLANRAKKKLKMQQMKMGIIIQPKEKNDWKQVAREKLQFDPDQCPCCKTGKMINILSFDAHGPPTSLLKKWASQQQLH